MFPMRSPLVFVLAVTGLLWVSPLSRAQDSRIQGQAAATAASAVALSEVPTGQAVVMYQNGGLTVEAQSAPLIDILREVCGQMGAELDAPPEAIEPVVGFFGPGPAREVLASLLKDSEYELATAGSVEDANAIVRVVVFSKTKDSAEQGNKNPGTSNSTAEPITQPRVDSTNTGEKATAQQMLDLLGEAKNNFIDNEAEAEDPSAGVVKAQTGDIFKALEALIKTAAITEGSGAAPSTIAPKTSDAGSLSRAPVRRRR